MITPAKRIATVAYRFLMLLTVIVKYEELLLALVTQKNCLFE
jgi:hypothetical protein